MSQMQSMERPYRIDIQQYGVPYGLLYRRTEPGYVLADGTVLLESERDEYGRYRGGAGMDGMYIQTGRFYAPVHSECGQICGFRELELESCLNPADISAAQMLYRIDAVPGDTSPSENTPEPSSIRDRLRQYEEQAAQDARAEENRRHGYMRLRP